MRRLLALLFLALPALGQVNVTTAPCKITDGSCAPMPNATTLGCAANSVAVFLGTPVALSCDGGLTYDATTDKLSVGALRIGTSTTAGWVLTADANGNGTWTAGGSGGGITNGAANGVIPKSDGTNLVGSSIFEVAMGQFTLAADASSADTSGANATLTPGIGRGNAPGSTLTISTPDPVASGSTVQTVTPRMTFGPTGAGVPELLWFGSEGAQVYSLSGGRLGFRRAGNLEAMLDPNGFDLSVPLAFAPAGFSNNPDTGLARASAGVLKVTDGSTGNGTIQIGANAGAGKVLTSDANGVASWQTAAGGGAIGSDTNIPYNDGGTMAAIPGFVYDKTNREMVFTPATSIPSWRTPFQVIRNGTGQEQAFVAEFAGYASATFDSAQNTQVTIRNKTNENNNQSMLMFASAGGNTAGIGSRNLNHSGWPSMQGELVLATSNNSNPTEKARLTKEGYFVIGPNNTNPGTSELYVVGDAYLTEGLAAKSLRMTGASRPTCDSSIRGTFWYVASGGGVKDTVEVCAKDAGDAYAWRTIY